MKRAILLYLLMVSRQITIRPQDIVVLIKIASLSKNNVSWLKKDLAEGLNLSNSEITNVFERLKNTGLIDVNRNVVQSNAFYEFLIYGLRATFPPYIGPETRGILTAANSFPNNNIRGVNYVWEDYHGQHRGFALSPLYPEIISAVQKDDSLYRALCACDMLRVGKTREITFAREWLKKFIYE